MFFITDFTSDKMTKHVRKLISTLRFIIPYIFVYPKCTLTVKPCVAVKFSGTAEVDGCCKKIKPEWNRLFNYLLIYG